MSETVDIKERERERETYLSLECSQEFLNRHEGALVKQKKLKEKHWVRVRVRVRVKVRDFYFYDDKTK
jgi:hypothetical protein